MSRSFLAEARGQRDRSNRPEVLWMVITAVIFIALAVMGQSVWGRCS
jgi:heme/copper-type cytochrome/quinol oxidase subunit 2